MASTHLQQYPYICNIIYALYNSSHVSATASTVKSKNFISQLTIIQWNCDHLLAKIEELRVYLEKRNVDVFFIQETKLISSDKRIKAKFPGYTIKRKDRAQPRGKEGNSGGGLLVGIKKGIPFRVANIDLRGYGDGITESYSIEIPLKNGQKIRFTNIYIPPIRNTSSEAERQRDTEVTTNKWPCERYDCLFGDFNAHAPVWDSSYEEADERGEIVDDWIRGTGMTTLNDPDSPTRIDRRDDENIQRKDTSPDIFVVHSSMADRFIQCCHPSASDPIIDNLTSLVGLLIAAVPNWCMSIEVPKQAVIAFTRPLVGGHLCVPLPLRLGRSVPDWRYVDVGEPNLLSILQWDLNGIGLCDPVTISTEVNVGYSERNTLLYPNQQSSSSVALLPPGLRSVLPLDGVSWKLSFNPFIT
jgi:hypothetical protein